MRLHHHLTYQLIYSIMETQTDCKRIMFFRVSELHINKNVKSKSKCFKQIVLITRKREASADVQTLQGGCDSLMFHSVNNYNHYSKDTFTLSESQVSFFPTLSFRVHNLVSVTDTLNKTGKQKQKHESFHIRSETFFSVKDKVIFLRKLTQ